VRRSESQCDRIMSPPSLRGASGGWRKGKGSAGNWQCEHTSGIQPMGPDVLATAETQIMKN
jgi:hypothetical protein